MANEFKDKIGNLLIGWGITPNLKGFYYILDAVETHMELPDIQAGTLYQLIAEKHDTDWRRVERSIRHAFSKISEYDKVNYFGDVKYSNMGYISIIAWKERGKE